MGRLLIIIGVMFIVAKSRPKLLTLSWFGESIHNYPRSKTIGVAGAILIGR